MTTELLTERHGHTLVLKMSGPATRNAMTSQVYAAGTEALHVAESDDTVKCVVLTGAGGHFSGGRDVRLMNRHRIQSLQDEGRQLDAFHRWIEDLCSFPKPVLAAVEGVAAGAGVSLLMACDMVIASESARLISAYAELGLTPDGGLSWQLARRLPKGELFKWLCTSQPYNAQHMLHWGIAQEVTPTGSALTVTLERADQLARLPADLVVELKEMLRNAHQQALSPQLDDEKRRFLMRMTAPATAQAFEQFLTRKSLPPSTP